MDKEEDVIIDLDDSEEPIEQIVEVEETPKSVVSQPATNRQKVDHVLDKGGSQVLQKVGVPKKVADKAIKSDGGALAPTGNKLVKNQARNQLANSPLFHSNPKDQNRLQNAIGGHYNRPIFNQQNNQQGNQQNNQQGNQEQKENIETKLASKAVTAASHGAVQGSTTDFVANALINQVKKHRKYIIISLIAVVILIISLVVVLVGGVETNDDFGKSTSGYITSEMTEDELLEQLEYYGYCKNKSSCKRQGAYRFFQKLKSTYESMQQSCIGTPVVNKPCGVTLNTALIIETINYYENASDRFDTYDRSEDESSSIFAAFKKELKAKQDLDEMIDDIDKLALAQTEFVQETCKVGKRTQVNYYYQISFDKYISYLKYGDSSSHPNYSQNPVKKVNEACVGPENDSIQTQYSADTSDVITDTETGKISVSGDGKGVDIANYALQFVGNPYVWGGTSLTNGADCSGFTMKVMEHFGISIPHNSREQANYGTKLGTDISKALPGDLIVYNGHVAIYLGDNSIVHASSPKDGIKVSKNAGYKPIVAIVRLWG